MKPIASPSANFGERRAGAVDMLVLHYTGMESAAAAREWLCDQRSGVSAHYLVDEDGAVFALVGEEMRAWHAGLASWAGESDINSRSIGIEIHNRGHAGGLPDYPGRQIDAVIALCASVLARHPVAPARVLAHSDVAPGRKADPGEKFPWLRLAGAGIGLWAAPDGPDEEEVLEPGMGGAVVRELQGALSRFGYGLDVTGTYDERTRAAVAAFQRHWRPARVDGRADGSTRAQLGRIARLAGTG